MTEQNTQNGYGVTADEILDFLKDNMVTQLEFKQEIGGIKQEIGGLKGEMESVKGKIESMKGELTQRIDQVETELTKRINQVKLDIVDHVTDKLADLKGELVILTRKEDKKLVSSIELLIGKGLITDKDARPVFEMEPFPRLMI